MMSGATLELPTTLEHPMLGEALSEWRSRCATFEEFTEDFLDQMEALRTEAQQKAGRDARRIAELKQQCAELESELELVRRRNAELAQTLDRQERQVAEERTQWSGELKELRRLLEAQSGLIEHRLNETSPPQPAAPAAANDVSDAAKPDASPPDAVVDSVMAQFAKLQQDVKQRRSR